MSPLPAQDVRAPCTVCMASDTTEDNVAEVLDSVIAAIEGSDMECELEEEPTFDLGQLGEFPAAVEQRRASVGDASGEVVDLDPNKDKRRGGACEGVDKTSGAGGVEAGGAVQGREEMDVEGEDVGVLAGKTRQVGAEKRERDVEANPAGKRLAAEERAVVGEWLQW